MSCRRIYDIANGIFLVSVAIFISSCANKTAPTGGPQDEKPPELISSQPSDGQLNFNNTEVILEFDEDVKPDKARDQILITPRINGEYTIRQRRNRIILSFDTLFNQNTTYTINFRESIVDITEGNPAENLSIAFSTGDYIDSLRISGYVQDVLNGTPSKKATIVLFEAEDTTTLFDGLPTYFTESNDSGMYEIRNIKAGNYRIYSFKDTNKNLQAEPKNESYGFYPDTLSLTEDLENINMNLIRLDIGEFNLISARPSGTTFDIRLNKYITEYTLQPEDSTIELQHYYSDLEHQAISVYNSPAITDSVKVFLTAKDSIEQTLRDTVWVKFLESRRDPVDMTTQIEIEQIPVNQPILNADLNFNKPVRQLNSDSIYLYLDSLLIIPFDSLTNEWNESRTRLTLSYRFADSLFRQRPDQPSADGPPQRPNRQPALELGKGAFIGIENDTSTVKSVDLPFVQVSSLATLIINLNTSTEEYFLQLINNEGKVVSEKQPARTVQFRNLPPGDYTLRAIIDTNLNGKWDPGNIEENQLSENIVYFTKRDGSRKINLRSNFEVTENFAF